MIFFELSLGFVGGMALGALFFGALWLTVRRIPSASAPAWLATGSYVARLGSLATGLYAVVHLGGAVALLAALLGILTVRQTAVRRISGAARPGRPAEARGD
ncbi:MAG: ATP synthase subunit I [Longimicrobiales bacterium]|nr:ATP synthase subunit I [Longimicrobiales bacterium]